jgi:hypothetical protein
MWTTKDYRIQSVVGLIMHNGQTADPLNDYAQQLKKITAKRKKSEDDYEEIAHIEFLAGLYLNKTLATHGPVPVLPALNIEATLINAAKKYKEGPLAKSGMICPQDAILEYEGPHDAEALWADNRFRFSAIVRVQRNRIVRMRPFFPEWQATITVQYETTVVDVSRVDDWVKTGGQLIGLCDWRPRYGRFEVV